MPKPPKGSPAIIGAAVMPVSGGKRVICKLDCGHFIERPACRALPRTAFCRECHRARRRRSRTRTGRRRPINRLYSRQLRR